jgi:radical SAM superfamily enzyme YgiQ (UPF0313 family)
MQDLLASKPLSADRRRHYVATPGKQAQVLLISTYDLGHQPFGLASPAAWLRRLDVAVTVSDLSRSELDLAQVEKADVVGFYVPMHTATILAVDAYADVRRVNPTAYICFFGLYAASNASYLFSMGADSVIGGEFEQPLVDAIASYLSGEPLDVANPPAAVVSLERQRFVVPDRTGLPALKTYAMVEREGRTQVAGYTEATRGCLHTCRHCPIVPVYGGRFRVVDLDVVLRDVAQQVESGATHISFGDPDFFNAPAHAMRIVRAIAREHPGITYDVTIKIEHLRLHRRLLAELRDTGCLFVTSAVESIDDVVLEKLDKGHSYRDICSTIEDFKSSGLTLAPTFVAFHPWQSIDGYRRLLRFIDDQDLIEAVAPIQLAVRLLIPSMSKLLELPDIASAVDGFDNEQLVYPWTHTDQRVDDLYERVLEIVAASSDEQRSRSDTFDEIWAAAFDGSPRTGSDPTLGRTPGSAVPHMTEAWFCCSEPAPLQHARDESPIQGCLPVLADTGAATTGGRA